MRIAVANLFQLSNTFNRKPTDWSRWTCTEDVAVAPLIRAQPGTIALIQSMNQAATDNHSTIVPIFEAIAPAGGPSTRDVRERLVDRLTQRMQNQLSNVDALILVLSGCALDEDGQSIDEAVLRAARATLAPERPLVAVWNHLANLSETMTEPASLNLSYDLRDAGAARRSGSTALELMRRLGAGELDLHSAFRRIPLLLPPSSWRPDREQYRNIEALVRDFEAQDSVCAVSVFGGFSYADQPGSGMSLIVTVDGDNDLAESLATRLRGSIWAVRDGFFALPINVETAVHEAMQSTDYPVIVTDDGDDPVLGASSEGTGMLWALIDLGARNATLAAITDAAAIDAAMAAGVGNTITFDLGGKTDHRAGYPVEVTARVRRILATTGAAGRLVRLDIQGRHGGNVDVVVSDHAVEPLPELFEALGIDLASKHIIAVKSSWRVRDTFSRVSTRLLETTTPGITTPILSFFDYRRVARPIYPLDPD